MCFPMDQTVLAPNFVAFADARVKNLASMSYRRFIVFRLEMADPEDAITMGHEVSAIQPHANF